jgi:hypothetical protein
VPPPEPPLEPPLEPPFEPDPPLELPDEPLEPELFFELLVDFFFSLSVGAGSSGVTELPNGVWAAPGVFCAVSVAGLAFSQNRKTSSAIETSSKGKPNSKSLRHGPLSDNSFQRHRPTHPG